MKKLLLLAVLGAVTLLGSCIRPEKLSFEGIESIQVKGATASQVGIDLGIKATNASGSNLTLTDMQLTISKEGRRIGRHRYCATRCGCRARAAAS